MRGGAEVGWCGRVRRPVLPSPTALPQLPLRASPRERPAERCCDRVAVARAPGLAACHSRERLVHSRER